MIPSNWRGGRAGSPLRREQGADFPEPNICRAAAVIGPPLGRCQHYACRTCSRTSSCVSCSMVWEGEAADPEKPDCKVKRSVPDSVNSKQHCHTDRLPQGSQSRQAMTRVIAMNRSVVIFDSGWRAWVYQELPDARRVPLGCTTAAAGRPRVERGWAFVHQTRANESGLSVASLARYTTLWLPQRGAGHRR